MLEEDEIDAAVPAPTKVLEVEAFVAAEAIDLVFLDQPYYLAPANEGAGAVFALLRDALAAEGVGALARTVIFRRDRLFFVVPYGAGLLAHTLHFDYEVRPAAQAFDDVPDLKIPAEMRDLAAHIIKTKRGHFDPQEFDDRYEAALVAVIRPGRVGQGRGPEGGAATQRGPEGRRATQAPARRQAATRRRATPQGRLRQR